MCVLAGACREEAIVQAGLAQITWYPDVAILEKMDII
jgi:hypothetical protein